MNIVNPNNVPHTTDRFVIITEGDLQRLRQYIADVITLLHRTADDCKQSAALIKSLGSKDKASKYYKSAALLRSKATALGKSQYALKHQALSNSEVVEYFNAVGISLVQTSSMNGVHGRSEAWCAVVDTLDEVAPGFMSKPGTGIECAMQAIRDLAAGTYKQPE